MNLIKPIAMTIILGVSACSQSETTKTFEPEKTYESVKTDARLGAVLIYADWCGSCKVLDPKINTVRTTNRLEKTKFITLDFTDKDEDAFFSLADAAGVKSAVRNYLGDTIKTGQLLLVDLDDQKVVGVIKKDMTEVDMVKTIQEAASAA